MARYIDADKVLDAMMFEMAGTGHQARAMGVIRYAETADVVPKSEVENLKDLNKQLEIDNFNANMNCDLAQQELDKLAEEYGDLITEKDELFDIAEKQMAEIEQLKRNLEQCENGYRQQMHLLQCKLADAESKVREIFEEIEDVLNNIGYFDEIDFKALKKKHTENKGE